MQDTGSGPQREVVLDRWAREAFQATLERPGIHRVGLALIEGGGRRLRFTASDRAGDHLLEWCHIDAYDDVPLNTAIRQGAMVLHELSELDERYPSFVKRQRGTPTTAIGAVPMIAAGQVVGAYVVFYDRVDAFLSDDAPALAALADHLGSQLRETRRREAPDLEVHDIPTTALTAQHRVQPDPAEVGAARRFLRRTLTDWSIDGDVTDTAVLCLSELVTNAVVHTHGPSVVQAVLDRGVLTVRVRDAGGPLLAATDDRDPLQVHGRGLRLVDALASRWGSDLDAQGTTVWFVLDVGA